VAPGRTDDGPATGRRRPLATLAAVAIAAYVLAFATTAGALRPLAGLATLVALAGFAAFAYRRVPSIDADRAAPAGAARADQLAARRGVRGLQRLAIAFSWDWAPAVLFEAHPATMEVGFIIPVAMALAEWGLRRGHLETELTRAGKAQVGLMLLAFLWVLGLHAREQPEVAGMGILFAIIGLIVFYVRVGRLLRATSPTARSAERHAVAGALWLGVTIVYIFVVIQLAGGDFTAIPRGRCIAFIHLMASARPPTRCSPSSSTSRAGCRAPSAVDDVVFWAVNVGPAGFAFALTAEMSGLYALFVPVMGLGLLVAIGTHLGPLGHEPPPATPATRHAPTTARAPRPSEPTGRRHAAAGAAFHLVGGDRAAVDGTLHRRLEDPDRRRLVHHPARAVTGVPPGEPVERVVDPREHVGEHDRVAADQVAGCRSQPCTNPCRSEWRTSAACRRQARWVSAVESSAGTTLVEPSESRTSVPGEGHLQQVPGEVERGWSRRCSAGGSPRPAE
jgi:hypothetical protein